MKIYTEVAIDMDTCEVVSEESFDYNGPMAMCGGSPGNNEDYAEASAKIESSKALGPMLTSSFEAMQKQFNAMTTVYDNQEATAESRYDLAENARDRADALYDKQTGEGGFIDQAWQTSKSQFEQAGRRKDEQGRQAGAGVSAAIRGSGEKSRRAAGKASTMARSQAARSGLAGAGSQGADLSDIYRDSAMATTATGEGYKKAMYASEDAYETAGYTRDAASLAKEKATFGAGQAKESGTDAFEEAGYAKDTAMQNIAASTAQMEGKMEMDIQNMLTSFYSATGVEYGTNVMRDETYGWFTEGEEAHDLGYDYFDETSITGG